MCLVYMNNQFAYCNKAWCKLTGYPESELLEMTWMDITVKTDIGGDMAEVQAVIDGDKEDYYNEKRYNRKNGTKIDVGLYVHRYPTAGVQIGWVVLGKELNSGAELDTLKTRFEDIEKMILMFKSQGQDQDRESKENRQLLLSLIGKGETTVNAPQGDQIHGNNNSTNRTTNESRVIFAVMGAVGLLCTVLISVAAVLAYMAYVNNNNPNMKPPEIEQHDLSPQGDN